MKSKLLLSSIFSSSVLFVLSIVIVIPLIIWASIAAFSEGQKELPSLKIISPTNGQNISTNSTITNNLVKWYSVNVTGVLESPSSQVNQNNQTITNATTQHQQQPLIQHQQQPLIQHQQQPLIQHQQQPSPLPASTSKSKS